LSSASPLLLRLRGVHPISAVIAAAFVFWVVAQAKRYGHEKLGKIVMMLLGIQFGLGLLDVVLLAPTWMQIVHLLGADLYWIALIVLSSYLLWPPDPGHSTAVA
jgi:cytochrome c oxidase assembly protein subunit 15